MPFNLKDYLDLVDYTGRMVRDDKRGAIVDRLPRLLDQLGLTSEQWRLLAIEIQQQSLAALGSLAQLEIYHASSGGRRGNRCCGDVLRIRRSPYAPMLAKKSSFLLDPVASLGSGVNNSAKFYPK